MECTGGEVLTIIVPKSQKTIFQHYVFFRGKNKWLLRSFMKWFHDNSCDRGGTTTKTQCGTTTRTQWWRYAESVVIISFTLFIFLNVYTVLVCNTYTYF